MSLPEEIKSFVIEESKDLNNFFETDLQKNIEHLIDRVKSLEMQVDNFASYKVQNIELSRQLSLSLNEKCDKIKDFEKYIATLNRQMEMSKCSNDIDALQFIPLNSIQLTKDSNLSNLNEKFHKYYQKYEKKYSDLCTSSMETSNKLIWFLISKINQEISNNQKTVSNIQNDKNKILKNLNSMKCENDRLHKFIKDVKTRRLSENVSNNTNQYNKNRRNTVAHLEKIIDNSVEIKMISQLSKDKDDIKCLFEKENKIVKNENENENKKKVINKFNI
ncbi:hypothetical protein A3Q56_08016 [Intoshia linei]|uniref:Uncharacterized protein n=1 Tax=Intoshia linei TaxID=1819745 RepID=A0A177AQJ7_9BILA|nr:hypothetical protein A3Q56_08016 [Intoshia linei]